MDLRKVGVTTLRTSRKQLSTGSISTQPRRFGEQKGKIRETRLTVKFVSANSNQPISHGLRHTPTSWQAMPASFAPGVGTTPGVVYSDSPLPADNRVICLKCTVAGTSAEIIVR